MSTRSALAALLLWAAAAVFADEPALTANVLLPGRLPWGPTALPDGSILAPCEDQTLRVLDPDGTERAQWRAATRIDGPVTTAPRGAVDRLAVPTLSGRIDILVWDPTTRVLAADAALTHPAEPAATAWGSTGFLAAGWQDGVVQAWAPWGGVLWTSDLEFPARCLLVDDGLGTYVFGDTTVVLVDNRGRESGRWSFEGRPRGALETLAGVLVVWTDSGVWKQDTAQADFHRLEASGSVLGVVVDRQDNLIVTDTTEVRRYPPSGAAPQRFALLTPAITPAVVDDRGRLLVGTARGLELRGYDGRLLGILGTTAPASAPLLLPQGLACWSLADWRVVVASGFRIPPFGWSQEGGGPGRAFSAHRPVSMAARTPLWADDNEFGYYFELASSGQESLQAQALDQLPLERPWAPLILLRIARSGLVDLVVAYNRVLNNFPANRMRAFTLLAQVAGPEDRDELCDLVSKEFDPSIVAQGLRATAKSGWDGDGKLIRLAADAQARMKTQGNVAEAALDAARFLWEMNGRATDPALVPLVTAIYQGSYPRTLKVKAQQFFQDLMAAE